MQAETTGSAPRAQLVGDRYVLHDTLGNGGMSAVYRGFDRYFERDVAVKVLRAELAGDHTFRAWFRHEAQSTAALAHPSIVAIYDIGEGVVGETRVPYLIMEYVEGRTLREILDRGEAPSLRRAVHLTAGILRALDHAHSSGLVHRDIKPGNVMVTRSGDPKLMDFGIARGAPSDTAAAVAAEPGPGTAAAGYRDGLAVGTSVVGTARYLSPEQARGEQVGPASDIYSTGCVLYELLTGTPPFTRGSSVAIAHQHVNEDPVPPSQLAPELPAWVDGVVGRALAKDPRERYGSAGDMRADIEHLLATRGFDGPATRRGRRSLLWMPVAVLALLVTALSGWSLASALGSVEVPDTVGDRRSAAEKQVRQRDLTPRVIRRYGEQAPRGQVFRQRPAPATTAEQGSTVRLFVSRGPRVATVPEVAGMSRREGIAKLREAGFSVGAAREKPSTAPKGRVLATDPSGRTHADRELPIDLTFSTGPVTMPALTGKAVEQARKTLRNSELGVGDVLHQPSTKPRGRVLSTDPSGGATVKPGVRVDLAVSTGPVNVPKVVGKPVGAAKQELKDYRLKVTTQARATAPEKKGTVVKQRPKGGSTVKPKTTLTLVVAKPQAGPKKGGEDQRGSNKRDGASQGSGPPPGKPPAKKDKQG